MNLYEHTIITRQDTSPSELKQLTEKYSKIIEKNEGEVIKTESWGLLNLAYLIKKNKKGSYIHFKIKGSGKVVKELEKNEAIDKKLIRYLTVKVKNFDLDTNYFNKKDDSEKFEKKEKNIKLSMPKRQSGNKKGKQSNFAKLSIFQPNKYKFKKSCPLSIKGAPKIDYKNIKLLKKYMSENGKILPSRITNVSQKKQRELSLSIKRARNLALL